MEFLENNRIKVDPPKKPKKLTATRFATILGLNAWSTPFSAWCEITRTYEEPFEDSIYTIAGKVIEPKVINYLNKTMFMDIKSPTDVYGPDYFEKTWGDFFPDQKELGGMWDALGDDFVVEIKTTKRAEDWALDVPIYYKLQACLYAYLLGLDDVIVTASFLEDKDYPIDLGNGKFDTSPTEAFEPSYKNTKIYEFKVSEAFPTFKETYIEPALKFWRDHVETGISPEFDEKKDANILKVLQTNKVDPTANIADISQKKDIEKLIKEAEKLHTYFDKNEEKIAKIEADKKRMKELDGIIKEYLIGQIQEGGKRAEMNGKKYSFLCTQVAGKKSLTNNSYERMKADGIYDKYVTEEIVRKADDKAMKDAKIYDDYAERGASTYSIKINQIIEEV